MKQRPNLILSVINDLSTDQRIHRIATTLQESGYEVLVVGRKLAHSPPLPQRIYRQKRMRLLFSRGKLFYLEYNLRLFFFLLLRPAQLLNANDLDTLLANYLVARLRRIPLVYDSHEYFTEVPELLHRPFTRQIWLKLESWIFPRLRHVYTVNESIARIYSMRYGVPVKTVRNVPFRREIPQITSKHQLLMYQGALNVGRGIELMIRAMAHLPANYQLWIAGSGDIEAELKALCKQLELESRVRFLGRIPLDELYGYTCQARLGFSLEEDLGANYRYASPNKVYDYLQAGLPVLVSDLPEMKQIVEEYGVGEVLEAASRQPQRLAERITAMLEDEQRYQQYVSRCHQAAQLLNWEQEQHKLLQIYQQACPPPHIS